MFVLFTYRISLIFGVVTVLSGITGVLAGVYASDRLRPVWPNVDPLICGCGLILSGVFMVFVLIFASKHYVLTWVLIFLTEISLSLNWSVSNDITLVRKIHLNYSSSFCLYTGGDFYLACFFWWRVFFFVLLWLFPKLI